LQIQKNVLPLQREKQKTLFDTLKKETAKGCSLLPLENFNNNLLTRAFMFEEIIKVVLEETTKLAFQFLIKYLKRKFKGRKKKRKKKRK